MCCISIYMFIGPYGGDGKNKKNKGKFNTLINSQHWGNNKYEITKKIIVRKFLIQSYKSQWKEFNWTNFDYIFMLGQLE